MVAAKQDANLVGLYKTREVTFGVVPAEAVWATREPNSFEDFGANYSKTSRRPFSPSRQRKKGSVTNYDASAGINEDLTQNNFREDAEEFFFAAIRGLPTVEPSRLVYSQPFTANATADTGSTDDHGLSTGDGPFYVTAATTLPTGLTADTPYWVTVIDEDTFTFASSRANAVADPAVKIDLTSTGTGTLTMASIPSVVATGKTYRFNNVPSNIKAGSRILITGYGEAVNNGVKTVTAADAYSITVSETTVNETTPPVGAKVKLIGHGFASGDVTLTPTTGGFKLTATSGTFAGLNLVPGSGLFIGGDAADASFKDDSNPAQPNPGYARIAVNGVSADGKVVTFDKSTFVPVASNGTGLKIQVWYGDVIKNEDDPDLIRRFSCCFEQTLGRDAHGIQSQSVSGCVANEMNLSSPEPGENSKVNFDVSYVGSQSRERSGALGPLHRRPNNTVKKALGEGCFNTSSHLYRVRMAPLDPATLNPEPIVVKLSEWSMTIKNNVSGAKAQGVMGNFDVNVGNFDVDLEANCYFSTVEAIHAVRCNRDMTFDAIYAKDNAGIFIDVPLIGLSGGLPEIEQDASIKMSFECAASESPFGHTLLMQWFPYLPKVAMYEVDC